MTFECTLVRGPAAMKAAAPEELTIAVPYGTSGIQVQSLLKEARGVVRLSIKGLDLATLTVGVPPLVSGAVIVDGPVTERRDPEMGSLPLMVLTHSGPSAGTIIRIKRGRFVIGRGPVDISVPDPGMSREHAVLEVSGTAVTLNQAAGAAPVFVDGSPTRRMSVNSATTVRCGNTTFSVSTYSGPFPDISSDAGRSVEEPLEVTHVRNSSNRVAVALGAGLPLVAGIGLVVATGSWMYLAFTAVSAVSLLIPLLAGRKARRTHRLAVSRAAHDDVERRRRCSPSAADILMASHSRTPATEPIDPGTSKGSTLSTTTAGPMTGAGHEDRGGIWVRLGSASALANIRLVPDDPHFRPPSIGSVPVTLDPRHPLVTLRGHPDHVDALLRFIMMQLASYPGSAETSVIILGSVERLPLSARFLSRVTLATNHIAAVSALRQQNSSRRGRFILIDDPEVIRTESVTSLLSAVHQAGWQVIHCSSSSERPGPVMEIEPAGTTAYLEVGAERRNFIPDLVPVEAFDVFCRSTAANTWQEDRANGPAIPSQCSFGDLIPIGQRRILRQWGDPASQNGLSAVLGKGRDGLVTFDFKVDGPHLLVAGTTGSGKSELLRTLIASVALSSSPDRTTFLFFDFKGGSGLGPLSRLPHCVGLLTDLGKHQLDRALVSLRAEIRHREELFAGAGASDLDQYHRFVSSGDPIIPRLVLVIDEFRMLVDEAPEALSELMRVATIGRSLGIHLVMATQRPQGALTADIRANVTSSIALRVQSDMESADIISSKAAASIRLDTPGRAYLARASSSPEEFQTASFAVSPRAVVSGDSSAVVSGDSRDSGTGPVQTVTQALRGRGTSQEGSGSRGDVAEAGTVMLISTVNEAWQTLDRQQPRRPIAEPLPSSVRWHDNLPAIMRFRGAASVTSTPWAVGPLALLDMPAEQLVEPLVWLPHEHGHLAMIGSASSGLQSCFRATSAMLATLCPQPHLYILDAAGILDDMVQLELIGAKAGLHQLPLAARILQRLAGEMEHRRIAGEAAKAASPLVLIVTGWCSWAAALRTGPFGWVESALQDIVRDGSALGITVLISGERELVSSRFFAGIQNRAYFPTGSSEESRFHWPRLPNIEAIAGRAVVMGNCSEGKVSVAQFREAPSSGAWPFTELPSITPPFRVRPLPEFLTGSDFQTRLDGLRDVRMGAGLSFDAAADAQESRQAIGTPEVASHSPLWIGVGGDEATPVSLPLRTRGVCAILGSPRSGKSSVLGTLQSLNPLIPWVYPADVTSPGGFWASTARKAAAGTLDPNSVLLVDDADSLDVQGRQALTALAGKVRGIVLTATLGPALVHQLPLASEVKATGMGLVLAPSSFHDGELLGVRLETGQAVRPGRGFIVNGTEAAPFQGALTTVFPPPT